MTNVLHVYAGNLYGGIEKLLAGLAQHAEQFPAMRAHFALCFDGRLSEELTGLGVPVHRLGTVRLSRPWTAWRARRALSQVLKQEHFDAVICHGCWPHALFAPVVRWRGVPLVYWAHDVPTGRHWLERWAGRTPPDLVLANSSFTQTRMSNLFPDVPSAVQYGPVSEANLEDRDEVRIMVRAALGTPHNAVVILLASRLERWKGHTSLLQALARLRAVPHWHCWIAGGVQRPHEAVYQRELEAITAKDGIGDRVRFLGQRSDVPQLLAAADIHCQPNTAPEPFGVAFVEALYAGLPVVTTAMGGALEIVDESCGILVPPDDPAALAEALRSLILDSVTRGKLGRNGPARARRLCDPSACLENLHRRLLTVTEQEVAA